MTAAKTFFRCKRCGRIFYVYEKDTNIEVKCHFCGSRTVEYVGRNTK